MGTIGQALIAQAQPYMFEKMALQRVQAEGAKGCYPDISHEPVALEPPYDALHKHRGLVARDVNETGVPEPIPSAEDVVRFQI